MGSEGAPAAAKRARLADVCGAAAETEPPPGARSSCGPAPPSPSGGDRPPEEGHGEEFACASAAGAEASPRARRRELQTLLLGAESVGAGELPGLLHALRPGTLAWHGGPASRVRVAGLLLALVAGSPRASRSAFVAEGLPLLLEVLGEAAAALGGGGLAEPGEAGVWAQGCMLCLAALPTEEAPAPEQVLLIHRQLCWLDRWSAAQAAALGDGERHTPGAAAAAAALRADISALLRRWGGGPLPSDPVRGKVAQWLVHCLVCVPEPLPAEERGACEEEDEGLEGRSSLIGAAADLEVALHRAYGGTTKGYSQHARMLRSNLGHPSNGPLRRRIVAGALSAEEVVAMDSEALAPTFLQEERRAAEQKVLREVTVNQGSPVAGSGGSPVASKSPMLPSQPDSSGDLRRTATNSLPGAAGGA